MGGSAFSKLLDDVDGYFKFFPLFELLDAQMFFNQILTAEDVPQRYCQFGGIPRHVFLTVNEKNTKRGHSAGQRSEELVTTDQVKSIASNHVGAVDDSDMSPRQPNSAIVGYKIATDDDGTFENELAVLVSPLLAEEIYSKYMKDLS